MGREVEGPRGIQGKQFYVKRVLFFFFKGRMIGKLQEVPVFSGSVSPKSWQVFQSCVAGSSGCWGESVGLFLTPAGALLLIVTCCSCSPGWFDSECGHVQLSQENEGWRNRACVTGDPPSGGQLGKVPQSGQGPGRRVRWLFQKSTWSPAL